MALAFRPATFASPPLAIRRHCGGKQSRTTLYITPSIRRFEFSRGRKPVFDCTTTRPVRNTLWDPYLYTLWDRIRSDVSDPRTLLSPRYLRLVSSARGVMGWVPPRAASSRNINMTARRWFWASLRRLEETNPDRSPPMSINIVSPSGLRRRRPVEPF